MTIVRWSTVVRLRFGTQILHEGEVGQTWETTATLGYLDYRENPKDRYNPVQRVNSPTARKEIIRLRKKNHRETARSCQTTS